MSEADLPALPDRVYRIIDGPDMKTFLEKTRSLDDELQGSGFRFVLQRSDGAGYECRVIVELLQKANRLEQELIRRLAEVSFWGHVIDPKQDPEGRLITNPGHNQIIARYNFHGERTYGVMEFKQWRVTPITHYSPW